MIYSTLVGFHNAPLSRLLFFWYAIFNIFAMIIGLKRGGPEYIGYGNSVQHLLSVNNFWRLFTGPMVLNTTGEFVFTLLMFFIFRIFERIWGSIKFFLFFIYAINMTFLLQFFVSFLVSLIVGDGIVPLQNGPYGFFGAIMIPYIYELPRLHIWKIGRFEISEKIFVYFLMIQYSCSFLPSSLFAFFVGVFVGIIYEVKMFQLSNCHKAIPRFLRTRLERHLFRYINPSPLKIISRRRRRTNFFDQINNALNEFNNNPVNDQQQQQMEEEENNNQDIQQQRQQRPIDAQAMLELFNQEVLRHQQQQQQQQREEGAQNTGGTQVDFRGGETSNIYNADPSIISSATTTTGTTGTAQESQSNNNDDEDAERLVTLGLPKLLEMGFDEETSRRALRRSGGNVQRAVQSIV